MKAFHVQGLKDWVVATFKRIGVEEELVRGVPEHLVGRELEEDFRVWPDISCRLEKHGTTVE